MKRSDPAAPNGVAAFFWISITLVAMLMAAGLIKNSQSGPQYVRQQAAMINTTACPGCNQQGTPSCPYCRYLMQWNSSQYIYSCPRCGFNGAPFCPSCRRPISMRPGGMIGCIPNRAGFLPQVPTLQQNGAMQAA